MSISEKANDLLNKFGSAQFDFIVWNTPDNLVARDKARQEISDYIAELEASRRWIPVGERLPEAETRVLAATPTGYMEVDWRFSEPIIDCGFANFFSLDNVTHWMLLPQPPEVKE